MTGFQPFSWSWLYDCVVKVPQRMLRVLMTGYDTGSASYQTVEVNTDGQVQVGTAANEAEHSSAIKTFTEVNASYATWASLLANATPKDIRILRIFNTTNGWLQFSFDAGSSTAIYVPPFGSLSDDLKGNEIKETSAIHMQFLSGEVLTEGKVSVSVVWITP